MAGEGPNVVWPLACHDNNRRHRPPSSPSFGETTAASPPSCHRIEGGAGASACLGSYCRLFKGDAGYGDDDDDDDDAGGGVPGSDDALIKNAYHFANDGCGDRPQAEYKWKPIENSMKGVTCTSPVPSCVHRQSKWVEPSDSAASAVPSSTATAAAATCLATQAPSSVSWEPDAQLDTTAYEDRPATPMSCCSDIMGAPGAVACTGDGGVSVINESIIGSGGDEADGMVFKNVDTKKGEAILGDYGTPSGAKSALDSAPPAGALEQTTEQGYCVPVFPGSNVYEHDPPPASFWKKFSVTKWLSQKFGTSKESASADRTCRNIAEKNTEENRFYTSRWLTQAYISTVFFAAVPKPVEDLTGQVTYDNQKSMGSGKFSKVYPGEFQYKRRKKKVAVKFVHPPEGVEMTVEEIKAEVRREARLQRKLSCENTLPLWGVIHVEEGDAIVTPKMKGSVLRVYKGKVLSFETILKMLYNVAKAILFIHTKGYVHCDLAWRNVFVRRDSCGETYLVGDFGLTAPEGGAAPMKGIKDVTIFPLATLGHAPIKSDDVYSFGIMIEEVMNDFVRPLNIDNTKWDKILQDLHKRCKSLKASERPSASEIVETLEKMLYDVQEMSKCSEEEAVRQPSPRPYYGPMTTTTVYGEHHATLSTISSLCNSATCNPSNDDGVCSCSCDCDCDCGCGCDSNANANHTATIQPDLHPNSCACVCAYPDHPDEIPDPPDGLFSAPNPPAEEDIITDSVTPSLSAPPPGQDSPTCPVSAAEGEPPCPRLDPSEEPLDDQPVICDSFFGCPQASATMEDGPPRYKHG
ncbi:Protein tyrosine and serine/threonine kinase [Pelomyxa schiedti]|nr:Protein tyrosine and serine/threonine kinase [Pelomyxa schiedti]